MRQQGAASVSVVALLDKVARRVVDLKPDYIGFEVCCPHMLHILLCAASSASGSVTQACSNDLTWTQCPDKDYATTLSACRHAILLHYI